MYLQKTLPQYMIPQDFVKLDAFPLTQNGKVNRKELPDPQVVETTPQDEISSNTYVTKLTQIFKDVLHIERVDIYQNFFSMGGDSIIGIQIIGQAQQMGLEITPQEIFENQTIHALSKVLEKKYPDVLTDNGVSYKGQVQLTSFQDYLFTRLGKSVEKANSSVLVKYNDDISPELLEIAFRFITNHSDVMQLCYRIENTSLIQEFQENLVPAELDFADISGLSEEELEETFHELETELTSLQELDNSPLVKLCLCKDEGKGYAYFLLICHQLIMDYVSVQKFLHSLLTIYEQIKNNTQVQWKKNNIFFHEWVREKDRENQSKELPTEIVTMIESIKQLNPVLKFTPVPGQGCNHDSFTISIIKPSTITFLSTRIHDIRIGVEEILLWALAQCIQEATGSSFIYVDCMSTSRVKDEHDSMPYMSFGNFNTHFPLYIDVTKYDALKDNLLMVKKLYRTIEQTEHLLMKTRNSNNTLCKDMPRPQVKFSFTRAEDLDKNLKLILWKDNSLIECNTEPYTLEIDFYLSPCTLEIVWNYNTNKCPLHIAEKISNNMVTTIENICQFLKADDFIYITPIDFPDIDLEEEELEKLAAAFAE